MNRVLGVTTNLVRTPHENGDEFAVKLSQAVVDGHLILSSGWDGTGWWAIIQNIQNINTEG